MTTFLKFQNLYKTVFPFLFLIEGSSVNAGTDAYFHSTAPQRFAAPDTFCLMECNRNHHSIAQFHSRGKLQEKKSMCVYQTAIGVVPKTQKKFHLAIRCIVFQSTVFALYSLIAYPAAFNPVCLQACFHFLPSLPFVALKVGEFVCTKQKWCPLPQASLSTLFLFFHFFHLPFPLSPTLFPFLATSRVVDLACVLCREKQFLLLCCSQHHSLSRLYVSSIYTEVQVHTLTVYTFFL